MPRSQSDSSKTKQSSGSKTSQANHGSSGAASSVSSKTSKSKGTTTGTSNADVYADNDKNRKLGRVGLPRGSMVESKSGGSHLSSHAADKTTDSGARPKAEGSKGTKTSGHATVDSKSHDSLPMRKRSPVAYRNETTGTKHSNKHVTTPASKPQSTKSENKSFDSKGVRVYKDNPLNNRLGRVGKPLGTMVFSRKAKNKSTFCQTYADTWFNRSVGRVGKPLGSQPIARKTKHAQQKIEFLKRIQEDEITDTLVYDERYGTLKVDSSSQTKMKTTGAEKSAIEEALFQLNRMLEEVQWKYATKTDNNPTTSESVIKRFTGLKIDFREIKLGKQIGHGGFGNVYFATWKETTVAVKKLRQQNVSNARLQGFTEEILTLCKLDHPNIVRFIGACVEKPNLAIVMEYMQMSLYDALHVDESVDFMEDDRLSIIRQTSAGLQYLHNKKIAHCDLKSQNVLLDHDADDAMFIKIADFGLSMVMSDGESSSADRSVERVSNVGTPRYSAPEVLQGKSLSVDEMMKTDIYSLALIIYEVLFQTEPFYDLTVTQIQKQVGEGGKLPEMLRNPQLNDTIEKLMKLCLNHQPAKRPKIEDVSSCFEGKLCLYRQ